MLENPLVSVIIPVYNREMFLKESLKSVYQQVYRPIELIVVDDGSTDRSIEITERFIEENYSVNFKILLYKQDRGNGNIARNKGYDKSHGQFIQFLDSDDVLLPNKIKVEVNILKSSDYDFIYSKTELTDNKLNRLNKYFGVKFDKLVQISKYSWQTMCPLYKREFLEKVGPWNEKLNYCQDWEFCVRAKLLGNNFLFLDETHSLLRTHEENRDFSKTKRTKEAKSYFEAYRNVIKIANAKKINAYNFYWRMSLRFIHLSVSFLKLFNLKMAVYSFLYSLKSISYAALTYIK